MKKQLKRDCKLALKTWGRIVAATLMCIIVYVSLYVLATAFFSEQIGYRITGKDEAGNAVQIAEHYYTAEEGPQTEPELEDGQKSTPIKQLTAGAQRGLAIISSVVMLFILASFPYDRLWKVGSHDENLVACGKRQRDLWRGVKVGLLADVPAILFYLLLVVSKCGGMPQGYLALYRFVNLPYMPYINAVTGTTMDPTSLSWLQMLAVALSLLFVPAVCGVAYRLGYQQFSFGEFMTFAKRADKPPKDTEI